MLSERVEDGVQHNGHGVMNRTLVTSAYGKALTPAAPSSGASTHRRNPPLAVAFPDSFSRLV